MSKVVKRAVLDVSNWTRVGKGIEVAEAMRHKLFTCAAILGRTGRNRELRLSSTDALLATFHAALASLLVPISNCKTVVLESPLIALMT